MINILLIDASKENTKRLITLFDEKENAKVQAHNSITELDALIESLKPTIIFINANFFSSDESALRTFLKETHADTRMLMMYASLKEYALFKESSEYIDDVIFKPLKKEELQAKIDFCNQKTLYSNDDKFFSLERMKMEAVGEMISMIAHQWRQPLSAMGSQITQVELDIVMDELESKTVSKVCDLMKTQIAYLSETIDDFRFYFTPSEHQSSSNLNEIVERAENVISIALAQNRISMIVDENLVSETLHVHLNEVVQVVINIINNAMDELIARKSKSPFIQISSGMDEEMIHLYIRDNAGGISDDVITKVFDPYFSTKKKKNGTGLGLYMAKNIIERHCGGLLRVKNVEHGAQFQLSFPISDK